MPARVDPEQRRRSVVEAAFRLVVAEGVTGVSLRKVAVESGLNIGSVRHYFDGHEDLLAAAAQEAGDRMGERLARHPAAALRELEGECALDALQQLVEEVLPVGEERRRDAVVVVEFVLASRTRPVFRPMAAQMAVDLSQVLTEAFAAVGVPVPEAAAAQLSAMIGGLTIDAVTPHGALTAAQLRDTVRRELRMLLSPGPLP